MKFIDLSYSISNAMHTYPSDPNVSIHCEKNIENNGSLLHSFKMGTHTGTHVDAPAHVIPGGKTLDQFPLDSFAGTAIKLNEQICSEIEFIDTKIDGLIYETTWYEEFDSPDVFYGPNRPSIPKKNFRDGT